MKAMILSAGLGKRLAPLTNNIPKPLIKVNDKCLIDYHIERIIQAGIQQVIINLHHLGDMIRKHITEHHSHHLQILYSDEQSNLLNTGGGIAKALPLLDGDKFVVINADIFTDYSIEDVHIKQQAHLVLTDNPRNSSGDFHLDDTQVKLTGHRALTFTGIGYYKPSFFEQLPNPKVPLLDILKPKIIDGLVTGEHYTGLWTDVGTLERLNELEEYLANH